MSNGPIAHISAGARKAMDAFMYENQTAVDNLVNAGLENEIVTAKGAFNLGSFLRGVANQMSIVLKNYEQAVHGSTNQINKYDARFTYFQAKVQTAEQYINSGVSQKQGMTSQIAKEQQNIVQFAQIVDTINSYLGNLIAGPLIN